MNSWCRKFCFKKGENCIKNWVKRLKNAFFWVINFSKLSEFTIYTVALIDIYVCGQDVKKENRFSAECMLVITSVMHLGVSGLPEKKITKDDLDRLNLCLKVKIG